MRCAVVGSGVSGMSIALLLARRGHTVTLLEAGPHPAPLLRGFIREGLHFDTGFHYGGGLHHGGVLQRWLGALGLWRHLHPLPLFRNDIFRIGEAPEVRLVTGTEKMHQSIEDQFPGQGESLTRLLYQCGEVLNHSPYTNPFLPHNQVSWYQQPRRLLDVVSQLHFPPDLEMLLLSGCLLYGVPPSLASWEDFALVNGPYYESCGTWQGGGAALADAFARELDTCGVAVRCRAKVTGLNAGLKEGVTSLWLENGEKIPCNQCYFTGHPSQLRTLLPSGLLRPAWFNRISHMPETCPPFMLFAETDALPQGYSLYTLPSPIGNCDNMFAPLGSLHPSTYLVCGHEQADAAPHRTPLMVMAFMNAQDIPADVHGAAYREFKAQTTARLVTLTEERCPVLRGHWRVLEAATAHTMRRWIHGGTGSLYGIRHDMDNLPLLPVTRVPGFFLAGQNILLPGVLGGIVSAALAVGFAHGHDETLVGFRECVDKE